MLEVAWEALERAGLPPHSLNESITGVYLRKGLDPIPNVRGVGEMDDRLEVGEVEVEIEVDGEPKARRYFREGSIWLGLVCGLRVEVPRIDEGE